MAKQSRYRRVARSTPEPPVAAVPATPEPPVRRWPHPVEGVEPIQDLDPALHYLRCALSYQNQLLADIKTLLQQLVPEETREDAENSEKCIAALRHAIFLLCFSASRFIMLQMSIM